MKKTISTTMAVLGAFLWGTVLFSMDMETEGHSGHGGAAEEMTMDNGASTDTFTHHMTTDGIRAEFQVMSLAGMNMTDPGGATHHIMAKFFHDGMDHQINEMAGRMKVIGPNEKEQVADLKNYSGIYAANFTFDQEGKYGVICLVKIDGEKHVFRFWYSHH